MSTVVPAVTSSGQPVLILKEGSARTRGKEAQRNSIMAAKLISEIVKSSLGPKGMDKMLVDSIGDATITNDGATILKQIDIQHPAAKMLVEVSKATDSVVGDGTTSAVVLAGALLEKAEELIGKDVHPNVIIEGYRKAARKALDVLENIALKISQTDKEWLTKVAKTSLQTKIVSGSAEVLAEKVVNAVTFVTDIEDGDYKVDINNIKIDKRPGGALKDTKMVRGIILDKQVSNDAMPKYIQDAKIALLNIALNIEKTKIDAKLNISNPEQIKAFLDEENKILKYMVEKIANSRANVLICQKGIDDVAQQYLAKVGILTIRNVVQGDMEKIARATGARITTNLDDLSEKDLGSAALVEERNVFSGQTVQEKWVFIEGCKNPKSISIFIRGGTQRIIEEVERALRDAIMVTKDVLERPSIVAGGGAPEAEAAYKVMKWANQLTGREQLAAQKFAESLESIPITLAINAGLDPIDTQVQLRAKHSEGGIWYGVDAAGGGVQNMYSKEVFEPLAVKTQVINSATETACIILRVDDVIASAKMRETPMPPGPRRGESEE